MKLNSIVISGLPASSLLSTVIASLEARAGLALFNPVAGGVVVYDGEGGRHVLEIGFFSDVDKRQYSGVQLWLSEGVDVHVGWQSDDSEVAVFIDGLDNDQKALVAKVVAEASVVVSLGLSLGFTFSVGDN